MKKIVTLSLAVLMTTIVMGQEQSNADNATLRISKQEMAQQKVQASEASLAYAITEPAARAAKRAAAEMTDTLCYLRPEGCFFGGYYPNGNRTYPRIFVGDSTSVEFFNASIMHQPDSTVYWGLTSNGTNYLLSDSTWNFDLAAAVGGSINSGYYFPMPWLVQLNDELEILNSYQYGSAYSDKAYVAGWTEDPVSMTTCAMYTDTAMNANGNDCYMVSAPSAMGKYCYGTGLNVNGTIVDTLITVYDNVERMWMDSLTLPLYSSVEAAQMIPAGKSIKIELKALKMNAEGKYVYTDSLLASFEVTNANIENPDTYNSTYFGDINLAFGAKNALGGFSPQPIVIEGMFYILITGLAQEGLDFGIFSDYFYADGSTHFIVNNKSMGWNYGIGNNIALALHAKFVGEQEDTAVEKILDNTTTAKKTIRDGQILIQKDGKTYNMFGAEVR